MAIVDRMKGEKRSEGKKGEKEGHSLNVSTA